MLRRLEELLYFVGFVNNDLVSLDRDEADNVPYNLVRAIRHETGCTRREAVEQAQRQGAQIDAVFRYLPALLRMTPNLSGWKGLRVSLREPEERGAHGTRS
ncbi:terpene synthase family protein [Nocardia sp. 2YAB30]